MSRPGRRAVLRGGLALAGAALLAGCGVEPARPVATRRLGFFGSGPPSVSDAWSVCAARLGELGYVEGQNLRVDYRFPTRETTYVEAGADLVRLQPEVIWVPSSRDAQGARAATGSIPIVCGGNGDLLSAGLTSSLGRPDGNVTGLMTPLLAGKQLELLRDLVPALGRAGVVVDNVLSGGNIPASLKAAAATLGVQTLVETVVEAAQLEPTVRGFASAGAGGLLVLLGPVLNANLEAMAELALRHRLPSVWANTEAIPLGGVLGYGPNRSDLARRSATYVDRIFKGARPGELPIEQPTLYDFVLNLKTAEALGLAVPPNVLQQATEVVR